MINPKNGYMDLTLTIYRRTYNRIHTFINQCGTDIYTREAGEAFLGTTHVCRSTFTAYNCAVRRLNDYMEGNPYRCHHGNLSEKVTETYVDITDGYLDECRNSGNKPAAIYAKERACVSFLNYIKQAGCSELLELDAELVSRALLIYSNKDNYARIRMFLKHLFDKGIID